jgi:hypothetical protein
MSWLITGTEKNPVDLSRSNVSLLLHGDGTNGSTTITDSSPSPKTVTAVGGAQISTAIADPFGNSARGILQLPTTAGYLTTPINSAFSFGSGNYTYEAWLYMTSVTGYRALFVSGPSDATGNSNNYSVYINSGTSLEIYNNGVGPAKLNVAVSISANAWRFVSVSRSGATTYVHVNGILAGSGSDSFAYNSASNTNGSTAFIGRDGNPSTPNNFLGYMDEVRITKGVARYGSSNYSVPAAPFPDI